MFCSKLNIFYILSWLSWLTWPHYLQIHINPYCHIFTLSFPLPFSPFRCTDEGQRLLEAGEWAPRALQHHFLRHTGRDPTLPPHTRTGLPLANAAPPPSADRLLPEDHRQAGGRAAEIRRWPLGKDGVRREVGLPRPWGHYKPEEQEENKQGWLKGLSSKTWLEFSVMYFSTR